MIHVAIGTKAQFIKMAPVIREFAERDIPFNLIDTGQHRGITEKLRREFSIREPDVCLSSNEAAVSIMRGGRWAFRLFFKGLRPGWVRKTVFKGKRGVCLIHGDTASTLLGLYLARRAGIRVAHVEAGLRSGSIREPFPEEIIRRIAMRYSNILFAPTNWAYDNLLKEGCGAKAVCTPGNTSLESMRLSMRSGDVPVYERSPFALVSLHRMENIFSKSRLSFAVGAVIKASRKIPVVFIQHPPTLRQLKRYGLQKPLEAAGGIRLFPLVSHGQFIRLLRESEFVMTDGGSVQEECFYLDKPCCLLRRYTERNEGLGENVLISGVSSSRIDDFMRGYPAMKRKTPVSFNARPSVKIVDTVSSIRGAL